MLNNTEKYMLETVIGVSILVVVALFAKKVFARNGSVTTQPITFGGGSPEPDTSPRHDDGSVTPPTKEGQNEM
jgi:hypothetical protein